MNMNDEFPIKSIFKAYDIRGVVGSELTTSVVRKIGQAIGTMALSQMQKTICVGYDGRLSSPDLSVTLIDGLLSTGIDVINIGLCTTPMLYFSNFNQATGTGVMITGSHNPPEYNGFKIVINEKTLISDDIQNLYQIILDSNYLNGAGNKKSLSIKSQYLDEISKSVKLKRTMKVAIDCGNGATGVCAEELFKKLGVETEPLFCDVDGNFPNHHPDPSNPKNLLDLKNKLKKGDSELGLAFDGDADRLGVVTKDGEIIFPDRQLLLFSEAVLKECPQTSIIFDVKSTRQLFSWIKEKGGIPVIWKTGHSLIKKKMKEINASLAGEMSGHMFFNDRWYGFDDGLYAAARLLEILSEFDDPSKVLKALPKDFSTPELNIKLNEGEQHKIIAELQETAYFPNATEVIKIDGLRVEYKEGFGLMRASNTTPVIVLRFEAETEKKLKEIQAEFKSILEQHISPEKILF
jgi:phosphomannomutase / phosphoglucomutase